MRNLKITAMTIFVVFSVIIMLAMLSGKETNSGKDILLVRGCYDFERMIEDTHKGILTDEEIRERVKEIRTRLRRSGQPGAEQAGDHLLRAVTGRINTQELTLAFAEVANVCR
jgi:hypothetical protein